MPDSFQADSNKNRFGEPAKFLPILFVCAIIGILWCIYIVCHCLPLLQQPDTFKQGVVQIVAFNLATLMLSICYVLCIVTHPGTIPGKEDLEPTAKEWERESPLSARGDRGKSSQETKRSGDRRHCKWCDKYKPDRCHHCRVCRTCILRMDHHCPWIYNCVGFGNHKFFFLLLLYSAIACHLIIWTMYESLKAAIAPQTPFLTMFFLLFGETLGTFMAFLVTMFFLFHVWLMLKSMTTIEFCEKSLKRTGYDANIYDRGIYGNIRAVLGENPLLWLLPCSLPAGDGLVYVTEEAPLLHVTSRDMDVGRGIRKKTHENNATHKRKGAGTGECAESDVSDSRSESGTEQDSTKPFEERRSMVP
jgi:hypothetical protein